MFVKELFVNMCIMCTLLFVCHSIALNIKIGDRSKGLHQVKMGIIIGMFGCSLLIFRISLFQLVAMDYRNIALILSALMGGSVALWISGSMISLFRLVEFGISTTSVIAAVTIIVSTMGCHVILRKVSDEKKQWFGMLLIATLSTIIGMIIIMYYEAYLFYTVLFRIIMSIVGGISAYKLYGYLEKVNQAFVLLRSEVMTDSLTGINNRRYFESYMEEVIGEQKKKTVPLTLIIFDIDHFKRVNDTYGHVAGDQVLKQIATIGKKVILPSDKLFRIGGEEFAAVLPHISLEDGVKIAEKLRKKVAKHTFVLSEEEQIPVTISLGVAHYPITTKSPYDLYKESDEALYYSKNNGRNQVSTYVDRLTKEKSKNEGYMVDTLNTIEL